MEASASEGKYVGKELVQQFATFYVGDLLFGIDVMQVQEIIRYQAMTPVPLSANTVEGLINLRGQIITAIDLRKRLDMQEREEGVLPMNVVVRCEDEVVSLLVDKIGDVLEVKSDQFEEAPRTLEGVSRDVLSGVYKLKDNLLLVLDVKLVLDVTVN